MMSDFFRRDTVWVGLVAVLGSEVLVVLLLALGLSIAGQPLMSHIRWFAVAFVAPVLLLRYYAHRKSQPLVTKTVIITTFVTFIAFMFYLLKTKAIDY